ncbi:hypothetical protein XENOCAPTIV_011298 [Xenoophorus captivus]|uniref:Uncharacterized protein n=1 Tax=Xenoophorus captivus TaxID=1517983 RepID=A0ABV0RUI3_9TELE
MYMCSCLFWCGTRPQAPKLLLDYCALAHTAIFFVLHCVRTNKLSICHSSRRRKKRKHGQLADCEKRPKETLPVHQAPDPRAGEGVPVQHVPDPRAPPRDQQERPPDGQTGQDLVPKPQDEAEENDAGE